MRCIVLVRSDLRPMFMCVTDPQPPNQPIQRYPPNFAYLPIGNGQKRCCVHIPSRSRPCTILAMACMLLMRPLGFGLSCVSSTDPQPPKPLSSKMGEPANAVRDTFALRYLLDSAEINGETCHVMSFGYRCQPVQLYLPSQRSFTIN